MSNDHDPHDIDEPDIDEPDSTSTAESEPDLGTIIRDSTGLPPIFVGRDRETIHLLEILHAGGSFVIRGKIGSGRRALLQQIHKAALGTFRRQQDAIIWPSSQAPKTLIGEIARQLHDHIGLQVPVSLITPRERARARQTGRVEYRHIHRAFVRETIQAQTEIVTATIRGHLAKADGRGKVILFLDRLELPPTTADMILALTETGVQLAATIEPTNSRTRVARLLWRCTEVLDLQPLGSTDIRHWVEQWLQRNPLHFDDAKIRDRFISATIRSANGQPAGVQQVLASAATVEEVTQTYLRTIKADSATRYIDMTPLLVIVAAGILALRYISRGAKLEELMIMAGVGTSVFWVLLYFIRMMSRKR